MLKQERFQTKLDQLGENNRVLQTELSALLDVSEDTLRPDICFLGICSIHYEYGVTGPDFEAS